MCNRNLICDDVHLNKKHTNFSFLAVLVYRRGHNVELVSNCLAIFILCNTSFLAIASLDIA